MIMGKWGYGLLSSDTAFDACGHLEDWLHENPGKTINDFLILKRDPDDMGDEADERDRLLGLAAHAINRRWPVTVMRDEIESALRVEIDNHKGWASHGGRGRSGAYCRLISLAIFAAHWYGEDVSRIREARHLDEDFPREVGEEARKKKERKK